MTHSTLFTRLLCTGAVGLFGLTVFAADGPKTAATAEVDKGAQVLLASSTRNVAPSGSLPQSNLAKYPIGDHNGGGPNPRGCVDCLPGDSPEGEPDCFDEYVDATNTGCNAVPPAPFVFGSIACGETVCGTAGTYLFTGLNYRDTDWYEFTVAATTYVTLRCTGQFPVQINLLTGVCPTTNIVFTTAPDCVEAAVSACLEPGTYYAFAAPSVFTGVACGSPYRLSLECAECPPGPANDNCADAIAVTDGVTPYTNVGANQDGPINCALWGSDVWFCYTATCTGPVTVTTCSENRTYDTVLNVYDGCSCTGTSLGCNDDGPPACTNPGVPFSGSTVTFNATAGNTYLIQVGGYSGAQGGSDLTITTGCVGACCIGGDCSVMSASACASAGGSYQGDGTDCGSQSYAEASCSDVLEDISSTGTLAVFASGCDDCGEVVGLPFSFPFFGNSYTTIGITSNGYLTFGGTLGDFSNDPIPTAAAPNDLIAPLWDDFHTGNFGEIYYQADGVARFMVMWNQVARFGNAASRNTFEAILYADGSIDYRYGAIDLASLSATVGIENIDGTVGLALASPDATTTCRSIDVETGGNPCGCVCPGDMDGDGDRDISDLALFLSSFGSVAPNIPTPCADIDGSGAVDISDLALFLSSFGQPC